MQVHVITAVLHVMHLASNAQLSTLTLEMHPSASPEAILAPGFLPHRDRLQLWIHSRYMWCKVDH